ncbi:hypothetical protein JW752_05040 [Candidatus Peregrinibacteria bacterium]|nr:hypothetical protein [Candidatus Peregrinibacteria bacterium]
MEFKELTPAQVITTRDFPVHSAEVLQRYFEIYRRGENDGLPPVPLMHKDLVVPHFDETTGDLFQEYIRQNPQAEYFLLNGSHRTTSANLTRNMIKGMFLRTEEDIRLARQIKFNGQPYQHGLLDSIIGNIRDLIEHFRGTELFETVQQKTDRMVDERTMPQHMIEHYRNNPR